jgi:hypothetical protein
LYTDDVTVAFYNFVSEGFPFVFCIDPSGIPVEDLPRSGGLPIIHETNEVKDTLVLACTSSVHK